MRAAGFLIILLLSACGAPAERSVSVKKTTGPVKTSAGETLSDEARRSVDSILQTYEQIRATLSADRSDGIGPAALKIEALATSALPQAPPSLQPKLQELANAAKALAVTPTSDLQVVRNSFGFVSEALIALLSSAPALADGRHVFECPMTKTYKKWIQTTDEIENPYYGKSMLSCGSKSELG